MQLPLTLELHPSRRLTLLLVVAHGAVLTAVTSTDLPVWCKLLVLFAIVLSLTIALARMYGSRRVIRLTLRSDGLMVPERLHEQSQQSAQSITLRIHPHSTVTALLTVILFKQGKRLKSLTLLPDALNADDYRRLRLWLRWLAETGAPGSPSDPTALTS